MLKLETVPGKLRWFVNLLGLYIFLSGFRGLFDYSTILCFRKKIHYLIIESQNFWVVKDLRSLFPKFYKWKHWGGSEKGKILNRDNLLLSGSPDSISSVLFTRSHSSNPVVKTQIRGLDWARYYGQCV